MKTTTTRRIGATDVAPLLGLGRYANARDVYERIVNGVERPANPAMRRGTKAEPGIRARYVAETGARLMALPTPAIFEHHDCPFLTASPDGIELDGEGRPFRVLELKSASRWVRWNGEPPEDYTVQCQALMLVLGLGLAVLYVSFGEESGGEWVTTATGVWHFQADAELQAQIVAVAEDFWTRHVLTRTPPAMEPMAKSKRNKRNTNQGEQTP